MLVEDAKAQARKRALAARRALGAKRRAADSLAICAALANIAELRADRVVAGYAALADEVDISSFAAKSILAGWSWCLPRVVARGQPLAMHKISGQPHELITGYGGILEPALATPSVALEKISVAIVPSVSVDHHGNRLGFGAGFYDRTFSAMPQTLLLAPIFSCQLVAELPHEAHDRKIDMIITESAILDLRT